MLWEFMVISTISSIWTSKNTLNRCTVTAFSTELSTALP